MNSPTALVFPKPGDQLRVTFEAFSLHLTLKPHKLQMQVERGENAGFSDSVDYSLDRIGDAVALLSWTEHIGTTVIHAIDVGRGTTRATIVKPHGEVERLSGTVEAL